MNEQLKYEDFEAATKCWLTHYDQCTVVYCDTCIVLENEMIKLSQQYDHKSCSSARHRHT